MGLVGPDPPVQPRHQVDVVGDSPRQLLRRVHVRVDEPYQTPIEQQKTGKSSLKFRLGEELKIDEAVLVCGEC